MNPFNFSFLLSDGSWPNCVGTWKSNITCKTSQMFEETLTKIVLGVFLSL